MADFTAVLALPGAPVGQQTLALANRGIAKGQLGDSAGAVADFTAVLALPDAPVEVKTQALFASGASRIVAGERDAGCEQLRQALALTRESGLSKLANIIQQALDETCSQSEDSS